MDTTVATMTSSTTAAAAANFQSELGGLDFGILCSMLLVALGIGLFYAWKDRHENVHNYYFGSGALNPITIGLSISLTMASAYTVIGVATQTYFFGLVICWFAVANVISQFIAHAYYIPLIRRLNLISIYEYLEKRFHSSVRSIASSLAILNMIMFMGINVYVPAMALNAVTTLGLNTAIMMTACICTVYTAIGGIKAVVWTDTVQAIVMISGQICICLVGIHKVGGINNIYESMERGGRLNFWNFDPDPTHTYSFWTVCIGMAVALSGATCADQSTFTRYLSCKSTYDARKANITAMIPNVVIMASAVLTGCIVVTYFEDCYPVFDGQIQKPDQLLPLMALKICTGLPGFTGWFISGLFSGALSTVSSGLNALSMLVMEDFIVVRKPNISERSRLFLSKCLVFVFGTVILAFAFILTLTETTFIETFMTISGTIAGPVLGLFTLGVFVPWANTKGAICGQILATGFGLWVGIGSFVFPKTLEKRGLLPVNWEGCEGNVTFPPVTPTYNTGLPDTLYALSPFHYVLMSVSIVVIVGTVVSLLTKPNNPADMDPKMFCPIINLGFLPDQINSFFRFGVPQLVEDLGEYKVAPPEGSDVSYTMASITSLTGSRDNRHDDNSC